ncbi:ImmA/IrrE family metallo-endopeptidase [Micromonospora tulbaghiae]|uniref:ImmA/IrrE family metallo-endopeptidase n=1 Tax=Micromonospora tulbaghiae TaxID=479978 RepID=UPI0033FADC58
MLRAPQVHAALGIDRSGFIDVFVALERAGALCMAKPMPRLFGFYYSPADNGPAVLLNASLDEIQLRHTAAHELGHHVFAHGSHSDTDLSDLGARPHRPWSYEEMQAESFAAWFLMPPPAVAACLDKIGVDRPTSPIHAYELARWLGTSYAGTVRHLHRLRMLTKVTADKWTAIPPSRIRAAIYASTMPAPTSIVFVVRSTGHEGEIQVRPGDVIVPQVTGEFGPLPEGLKLANAEGLKAMKRSPEEDGLFGVGVLYPQALEVTSDFRTEGAVTIHVPGHDETFRLRVRPTPERLGIVAG